MSSILAWIVAAAVPLGTALLFIPRTLWQRWRERIVDHLDQALRRKVSRFDRHYRELVLRGLRFIDHKGLATVGFFTPELDEVFVDVSLAYRAPHEVADSVLAQLPSGVTDRHAIGDFLDKDAPVVLAVVGVPGSGKTTLLRHTARRVCQDRRGLRRTIAILLYLRDHAATIVAEPGVGLATLLRGRFGDGEPPGWFDTRLRGGDCVILLDGLDEVARQADRRSVADWVERQTRQHHRNDFVITSRPHGYRSAPIDGAVVLQVRGFTSRQVASFVHGWYLAVERHSTGVSGEDVQVRAKEAADDLLDRLRNLPALSDLTINPLLLTMIANVHRYRGALPGSRVDLYGEICQVMLWRRHEAKRLPSALSGDRKEALLRALAFTMMRRQLHSMSRDDLLTELKPALRRTSTQMSGEDFLADVSSNGLLVEREAGQYSFAHLTFQEYLAAMHIRDKGCVEVLAESAGDVWWRETTLLYSARADGDQIVEACLRLGGITALALAFDIADAGDLAPDLRDHLTALLDATDDDQAHRRLVTAVRVTRYLRDNLIRTGAAGQACSRPVSTEIYDLFCADTGRAAPLTGDTGSHDAVTGVGAGDAEHFLDWVNEITDSTAGYRLPTRAEVEHPAVQRAITGARPLSVWVRLDGPPSEEDRAVASSADLVNALKTLRKGRSLWSGTIGERVGPALRGICGVSAEDQPDQVRQKVTGWLERLARELPADLRLAVLAAFGLLPEARLPLYQDRVAWAASRLNCDPRTTRRRIDDGIMLLAQAAVGFGAVRASPQPRSTTLWVTAGTDHPHLIDAATLARHVSADITRNTAFLAQLALVHAFVSARDLALVTIRIAGRDRERDLGLTRQLDRDLERQHSRILAREFVLTSDLCRTVALASSSHNPPWTGADLVGAIDLALSGPTGVLTGILDLTDLLARARDLATQVTDNLNLVLGRARSRGTDQSRARVRHFASSHDSRLTHQFSRMLDSHHSIDIDLTRDHDLAVVVASALRLTGCGADVMGRAMSAAVTDVPYQSGKNLEHGIEQWRREFAGAFMRHTGASDLSCTVSREALADLVDTARGRLLDAAGSSWRQTDLTDWARSLAGRLEEIARLVVSAGVAVTEENATAVRIVALCLAKEADVIGAVQVGDIYRQIAAGITVLERQASGAVPATETIVLAMG